MRELIVGIKQFNDYLIAIKSILYPLDMDPF